MEDTSRVGQWVELNCPSKQSKKSYKTVLRRWAEVIYGATFNNEKGGTRKKKDYSTTRLSEYIDRYVNDTGGNFTDDVKRFQVFCRENYAADTHRMYTSLIVNFFECQPENRIDKRFILDEIDRKAVRRLMPVKGPELQDEINTKEEILSILEHCPISTKAMTLFLISGGVRVGEALKVRMSDVKLDTDPPSVFMRRKILKRGIGERTANFSYEARDAIKEWHKARKGRRKKVRKRYSYETQEQYDARSLYDEDLLFGFSYDSVKESWYAALEKVGLGDKDATKKMERYMHHIHTMRKFFKTKLLSTKALPEGIPDAWLGHQPYLGMYTKYTPAEMGEMYKGVMWAVSLYGMEKYAEALPPHVTVDREELDEYLKKKWKFVENLGDGTYIVERPGVK